MVEGPSTMVEGDVEALSRVPDLKKRSRPRARSLSLDAQQSLVDFAKRQSSKAESPLMKKPVSFETPEMLAKRRGLKAHPDVSRALDAW